MPDDSLGESFRALDNRISLEHVQAYFNVGVAVGDAIAGDPAVLSKVAGDCAMQSTLSKDCTQAFIERFVRLVYRNPPSQDEVAALAALDDGTRTPAEAVRAIAIVAMSSPRFVNHLEIDGTAIGGADDLLQLTGYEIASRLSYLFWQTMPDAELFAAAEDGSLQTETGFAAQLDRVFADARTHETLWQFWNEWLRLEKFTGFETTRPGFAALAEGEAIGQPGHDYYADMVQEIRDLTELFTFERTAPLADLLSTDESVTRSADLGRALRRTAVEREGAYPKLPAGTRAGLFQRARAARVEPRDHQSVPSRRVRAQDAVVRSADEAGSEHAAAQLAHAAAGHRRSDHAPALRGQGQGQPHLRELPFPIQQHRLRARVVRRARPPSRQGARVRRTGRQAARRAADRHDRRAAHPARRRERGDERGRAEPAHRRQRKGRSCLATKYFSFTLRRAPVTDTLDSCTIDELASSLKDPQAGLADAFKRIARHAVFFVRKVGPQ